MSPICVLQNELATDWERLDATDSVELGSARKAKAEMATAGGIQYPVLKPSSAVCCLGEPETHSLISRCGSVLTCEMRRISTVPDS